MPVPRDWHLLTLRMVSQNPLDRDHYILIARPPDAIIVSS